VTDIAEAVHDALADCQIGLAALGAAVLQAVLKRIDAGGGDVGIVDEVERRMEIHARIAPSFHPNSRRRRTVLRMPTMRADRSGAWIHQYWQDGDRNALLRSPDCLHGWLIARTRCARLLLGLTSQRKQPREAEGVARLFPVRKLKRSQRFHLTSMWLTDS